jgi:hypothetical protein
MRQLQTMCAQKHLDWILILETDRMPGGARGKEVPICVKNKDRLKKKNVLLHMCLCTATLIL